MKQRLPQKRKGLILFLVHELYVIRHITYGDSIFTINFLHYSFKTKSRANSVKSKIISF
jgi:hypothetical protein